MYKSILNIFDNANKSFLNNEKDLILSWINERTLCWTLSQYLRDEIKISAFSTYYSDVEYNRNNWNLKTIKDSQENIINIICDIIVHSRWENIEQDNLIAIEMKKSTWSKSEKQKDKDRLIALTKDTYDDIWSYDWETFPEHVCGYILGVYYEININSRKIYIEFYKRGNLDNVIKIQI